MFGKAKEDWPEDYAYAPSLFHVHASKDVEVECWRSILIFHQAQAYDADKKIRFGQCSSTCRTCYCKCGGFEAGLGKVLGG